MKPSEECETCIFWSRNQRFSILGECEIDIETKTAAHYCSNYESRKTSNKGADCGC